MIKPPAMNRISYIMVFYFSLCCLPVASGQLLPEKVAEQFFLKKLAGNRQPAVFRFEEPIRHGNIWIFECRDPEGFVLVRETDSCRIAGYSTSNRFFCNKQIPEPAMKFIESLSAIPDEEMETARLKNLYHPIGPLIRTTWSQDGYFNYYCPEESGGPDNRVYAGCAAVAMGQIIRYFGKFNDFQLTVDHDDHNYGKLTAVVGNYEWNRMENRPITIDTEVSQLLYGLGVLTKMNYGPSGSSTSNFNVYDAFKKLKYFTAIRMVRATTANDVWVRNFHQNIADFQPVYISGSGHSFICDGVDADGLFHFNLGWYGYADGYYPLNAIQAINPSEAIFGLRPYSNNLPPSNLTVDTTSGEKVVKWEKHRLATMDPDYYRVYLNDTLYYETREAFFIASFFPPGNHEIMVSAIYPQGESIWIGPIPLPVAGGIVNIQDPVLKKAILDELAIENITPLNDAPTFNELLKLQKLEIRQPLSSLAGLEYCKNIQVLSIVPDDSVELNLEPVSQLKRLKWLELRNNNSDALETIARNDRLIHLDINRCNAGNLSFLNALSRLLTLKVVDIPILDPQLLTNLISIKQLTLSGCNLSNSGFIQAMNNLEYIDLSRNQLQRFRLSGKLPELRELNISRNQINELYFLEDIPNVQRMNLSYNQLARFITGMNFNYLKELYLDNNLIDSLWFGVPTPALTSLSLNHNRIRSVSLLKNFAPGLTHLDLADNLCQDFWNGSLQSLEYLDFSNNRINLLNDLPSNPLLKHIDMSDNRLTDIYPVFDHNNSTRIQFLDLTGNPLSVESIQDFAPSLHSSIDTLLIPDEPQKNSPCHPQPMRNQKLSGINAQLVWQTDQSGPDGHFEIYSGLYPDSLNFAGVSVEPYFQMDVTAGQHYFWRVRNLLPDTSFISGLFNFITYQPITLPFNEGFEDYPAFSYFTELSDYWIKSGNGSASVTDGRIDPYRKYGGKQAIKLMNASDLTLPISHLYQSTLYISMHLLIGDGCIGSVRLNDLNGAGIEFYFKSNKRCDLLINNQLLPEISYPAGEWFQLNLKLYGQDDVIWVKLGSAEFPVPWVFTGNTVHAGELEVASAPGRQWPTDGQPLFYIDEIEIKASGAAGTENIPPRQQVVIGPNPASEVIYIELPDQEGTPEFQIFDFSGRSIQPDLAAAGQNRLMINIRSLAPGIYILRVKSGTETYAAKICISH